MQPSMRTSTQCPPTVFRPIHFVLPLTQEERAQLLRDRLTSERFEPGLQAKGQDASPSTLKFDEEFRVELKETLSATWRNPAAVKIFMDLVEQVQVSGCVILDSLILPSEFITLVAAYTKAMGSDAQKSSIHARLPLEISPEKFLLSPSFNFAFLHPLLIAIVSYLMGAPVRLTAARGKDTEPLAVLAQDNMLHIDSSPFQRKFKIVLTWEKDTIHGPAGQNFTFLPGTHHGYRKRRGEGVNAWSSENGAVFRTEAAVDGLFKFQRDVLGMPPTVVEVKRQTKELGKGDVPRKGDGPLTMVFEGSKLVHHRYRTPQGKGRSCVILTLHRIDDDPGQLVSGDKCPTDTKDLMRLLVNTPLEVTNSVFLNALKTEGETILRKLQELEPFQFGLSASPSATKCIDPGTLRLSPSEIQRWKKVVTTTPSNLSLKSARGVHLSPHKCTSVHQLVVLLTSAMFFDKNAHLDMNQFPDGREASSRHTRQEIRDMAFWKIRNRLGEWIKEMLQPEESHVLSLEKVKECADLMATKAFKFRKEMEARIGSMDVGNSNHGGRIDFGYGLGIDRFGAQRLSKEFEALGRLFEDLGEGVLRCESGETLMATQLCAFWATDGLMVKWEEKERGVKEELLQETRGFFRDIGGLFLRGYVGVVLLIEDGEGVAGKEEEESEKEVEESGTERKGKKVGVEKEEEHEWEDVDDESDEIAVDDVTNVRQGSEERKVFDGGDWSTF